MRHLIYQSNEVYFSILSIPAIQPESSMFCFIGLRRLRCETNLPVLVLDGNTVLDLDRLIC